MFKTDLVGQKFGRLTVIKFSCIDKFRNNCWLCSCDCGNTKIIQGKRLTTQQTRSCGCLHKELLSKMMTTHGMSKTRLYNTWENMKRRCFDLKNKCYNLYGGRGITVCDRWMKFENFRDDMYNNYQKHCNEFGIKNTTIDRTNNNGDYNKENCRWATAKEQANNSRRWINKK